jgi:hypothetical protein
MARTRLALAGRDGTEESVARDAGEEMKSGKRASVSLSALEAENIDLFERRTEVGKNRKRHEIK